MSSAANKRSALGKGLGALLGAENKFPDKQRGTGVGFNDTDL